MISLSGCSGNDFQAVPVPAPSVGAQELPDAPIEAQMKISDFDRWVCTYDGSSSNEAGSSSPETIVMEYISERRGEWYFGSGYIRLANVSSDQHFATGDGTGRGRIQHYIDHIGFHLFSPFDLLPDDQRLLRYVQIKSVKYPYNNQNNLLRLVVDVTLQNFSPFTVELICYGENYSTSR